MHPTTDELRSFVNQDEIDADRQKEIAEHLQTCEFCSEFCESYEHYSRTPEYGAGQPLPDKMRRLAENLFDTALRCSIIDLKPLVRTDDPTPVSHLAADGVSDKRTGVHSVATFCSESPEVVLRVMRNPKEGGDYLQLLAEDARLAAHVMVQIPQLGKEYVTDADGRASVDLDADEDLEQLKWQIKMPEAVFSLEPLKYDPDKVEYAEEIVLQTERHDRVDVRFEGRTEGKLLSIRVLELDGQTDFGSVRMAITQQSRSDVMKVQPGQTIEFGPIDSDTTINIRLYR